MKKLWDAINGNKTVIGMALCMLSQIIVGRFQIENATALAIFGIIYDIGGLLTGVGFGHKVIKKVKGQ